MVIVIFTMLFSAYLEWYRRSQWESLHTAQLSNILPNLSNTQHALDQNLIASVYQVTPQNVQHTLDTTLEEFPDTSVISY